MAEHRDFFNRHKPKSTDGIFADVLTLLPSPAAPQAIAYDLCCGSGQLAGYLAQAGYRAYGFDIADRYIGREGAAAEAFVIADTNHLPLITGQAQVITFIDSLQYFDDPQAIIAELARLLVDGGTLILSTQNNYNAAGIKKWAIQTVSGRTWSPWLEHPVENFMTYPQLMQMLADEGLVVDYVCGLQFLTAWVSLLPSSIRHWSPWRDQPWRSLASVASRVRLPRRIEESFLRQFAMITLLRATKG